MDWPKQNTGLFAVATCAFCPSEDLFSLREYDSLDGMEPYGRYDIGAGQTEAEAITAAEANGPSSWCLVQLGFSRWGYFCYTSFDNQICSTWQNPDFDYQYTDAWEASVDDEPGCYEYRRLRFKRERTALLPNTAYDVTMDVYRDVMGGTEWSLYATLTDTITTDATGRLVWEADVPHARGYKTWVAPRTFTATQA